MSFPTVRLGDVIELAYGRPLADSERSEVGSIPVFGANGVKAYTERFLFGSPTVIVGRKGSVGEMHYCDGPSWALDVAYYIVHDEAQADLRFLYWQMKTLDLPSFAKGVKPGLNRNEVYNLEVVLPPKAEQRRIVALLDEATQHIADLEFAYAQTSALWTDFGMAEMSSIVEGLECPWLRLGECCEILDSMRRPITKRDRRPGPFPYFGATGEVDKVAEYLFDEPLVLLGEDGAKWGRGEKSAFSVYGKCWVNNHAHVLRPLRDMVQDDWLVAYLCHADLSEFITGLTVPKLNQARMREIPIPVPTLEEQEALVARLGEVGEVVAHGRVGSDFRLRQLANLRQSVLEAAFRGEM